MIWYLGYGRVIGYTTPKNSVTDYRKYLKDATGKFNKGDDGNADQTDEDDDDND